MIMPFILAAVMICVVYFLYNEGIGTVNMKMALMDMTSFNGNRSRFSSCSGYMKRVIKFKEDRIYRFSLDLQLSKGDFWIELLDCDKNVVLRLDKTTLYDSAELCSGKRYTMVFRFKSASGSYNIEWN